MFSMCLCGLQILCFFCTNRTCNGLIRTFYLTELQELCYQAMLRNEKEDPADNV